MSNVALDWAWKLAGVPPMSKLVLVCLCDHATDDDFTAYPSLNTIADECGINRSTVIRSLAWLSDMHLISEREKRGRPKGGGKTSTLYRLAVGTELPVIDAHRTYSSGTPHLGADSHQGRCTEPPGLVHTAPRVGAHRTMIGTPIEPSNEPSVEPKGGERPKRILTLSDDFAERMAGRWPDIPKDDLEWEIQDASNYYRREMAKGKYENLETCVEGSLRRKFKTVKPSTNGHAESSWAAELANPWTGADR